jgi:hypothetical protein
MQTPSPLSDRRALLLAKFEALLNECDLVADNASFGETLNDMEEFFLIKGRKFLQDTFQEKLQERIDRTETTDDAKQCPHCKKKTRYQDDKMKTTVSVHGSITLERCYRYCRYCKTYSFPVDATLGLTIGYTKVVNRYASRLCGLMSYRVASETLEELCQISISHTKIGDLADGVAGEIAAKQEDCPAFQEALRSLFQNASGETEFYVDGTCVHVRHADGTHEWREFKLGAFARRLRGLFAFPHEWGTRKLPHPSVVSAFALISNKEDFQQQCHIERRRLGVGGVRSALGDGAAWIWNLIREVFGKTDECLDIYHALEHVSDCGKVLYGSGQGFKDWLERVRLVLLSSGFSGIERELQSLLQGKLTKARRESVVSLQNYLRKHSGRLHYSERLAAGRAIGSGLIEGACKNLVGKRLKQTGACWRLERANRIATLTAALYSDNWKLCWKKYN